MSEEIARPMAALPAPAHAPASLDDAALAARVARDDHAAFEALMRRHNGRLFRVARAILKDETEAEDALQDAYLDAYRHMAEFRGADPEVPDTALESPPAAVLRDELRRVLERRIDDLPVAFRTVFVMRDVEDMSVQETADCLAIPASTVRTRLFRARALLREALARDLDAATVAVFDFAGERCDRIVAGALARVRALSLGTQPFTEESS